MNLKAFLPVVLTRDPAAGRETLAEYRDAGGYQALGLALRERTPADILDEVSAAELRGRGGAAFPTARKWRIAAESDERERYLVANGGEHEPGSRKDQVLLATHPHRVLEGVLLAAYATGAARAYIYVIEELEVAVAAIEASLAEATAAGLTGTHILGSGFSLDIRVVKAPSTYVAGEETAALEVIEGRPPLPRKKPPYPGQAGLWGKPTTVNNVETLAHVPAIVRRGATWFRTLGTAGSHGTMLFTLDDRVMHSGVHELPFGATFRDLIEQLGGGLRDGRGVRGILPARSCAWLPAAALDTPMDHESLRRQGATLGCGGVSILPDDGCVVEPVMEIAGFFMAEQCGQCPPCRMETNTIAAVLKRVAGGEGGAYREQIEKIAAFTARKGQCSLIEMAAAPVLSALRLFPEDFAHHAAHGRCRSR